MSFDWSEDEEVEVTLTEEDLARIYHSLFEQREGIAQNTMGHSGFRRSSKYDDLMARLNEQAQEQDVEDLRNNV